MVEVGKILQAGRFHRYQRRDQGHLRTGKGTIAWCAASFASLFFRKMCHNVHMKTISIRELHLKTGRWVRHAASRGPIVVTDRGRRVAALQAFDASVTGRPLPNREAAIRKRSKVPVDSAVYQAELREDR
jgi:antitoxin (DNA-binding transcriptional repressor) of toxin-antitoxin stability system